MKKMLFVAFLLFGSSVQANEYRAAKGGIKLELLHQLMVMMNQCLELKVENELLKDVLNQLSETIASFEIASQQKVLLQDRIEQLMCVLQFHSKNMKHVPGRLFERFKDVEKQN